TPGKKFARIRVVDDTGRPPNLQQATLRALLRPIDDILFIGFFAIVIGKQEKRLGDMVAGTIVTRERSDGRTATIATSTDAQSLVPELLKARNFATLTPQDFALAREYLQRRKDMFPKARVEVCRQLAMELKETIALEAIPEGVTATQFLEAIYLAYQQNAPQPELG
ncbi:MAG: RDD family protein, partial [Cyanobacteria bacterium J06641_5]